MNTSQLPPSSQPPSATPAPTATAMPPPSIRSETPAAAACATTTRATRSAKIVVAGGFGVGKTTFVGAVSEISPLSTEASMTAAAAVSDDASRVESKTSTTVAMDFGRIAVSDDVVVYLFGTPGQNRFAFMWDQVALGALGAVVMLDTARLADSHAAIDYFEAKGIPFVVAANGFDHSPDGSAEQIRTALTLGAHVPVVQIDARDRESVKHALLTLVEHLLVLRGAVASEAGASAGR